MPGQDVELGSDGLPVLIQGPWSKDKLHFVSYFSSLFNGGMKDLWPTRAYVDLFSGPGRCKDRETGTEYDGSPLEALQCPTPFTHLFFNDINDKFVEALKKTPGAAASTSEHCVFQFRLQPRSKADCRTNTAIRSDPCVHRSVELRANVRRTRPARTKVGY